jgi:hypothetical protein
MIVPVKCEPSALPFATQFWDKNGFRSQIANTGSVTLCRINGRLGAFPQHLERV